MTRVSRPIGVLAALLALTTPVAAQAPCAALVDSGIGPAGSYVLVPSAGATRVPGAGIGVTGGWSPGSMAVGAATEYTLLEAETRPLSVRARAVRGIASAWGVHACAGLLAGLAFAGDGDDRALSIAGGPTATLVWPLSSRLTTYAGVRALGARTSATILARDVAASGLSVGGEGGIVAGFGRVTGALRLSADGFDPALGFTPFPDLALRLSAGLAF